MKKTYEVVYNGDYGGFYLDDEHEEWLLNHGFPPEYIDDVRYGSDHRLRSHPLLVQCVKEMNKKGVSDLAIEKVPEGEGYYIGEYDGLETVITKAYFVEQWKDE